MWHTVLRNGVFGARVHSSLSLQQQYWSSPRLLHSLTLCEPVRPFRRSSQRAASVHRCLHNRSLPSPSDLYSASASLHWCTLYPTTLRHRLRSVDVLHHGTRYFSSDADAADFVQHLQLTASEYLSTVENTLDLYCEAFEELESVVESESFDVNLADGVLTVNLGPAGIYVINKQTPNRQLWLSSPLSGPKRYYFDVVKNNWLNTRDDTELSVLLETEINQAFPEASFQIGELA
mmetsp:Transcript_10755/g.33006  ORF Transcript_10755/g.33006 Transcript_10755/m.33006 type:complete len:234 (+) Transcript_10755:90-791(+)